MTNSRNSTGSYQTISGLCSHLLWSRAAVSGVCATKTQNITVAKLKQHVVHLWPCSKVFTPPLILDHFQYVNTKGDIYPLSTWQLRTWWGLPGPLLLCVCIPEVTKHKRGEGLEIRLGPRVDSKREGWNSVAMAVSINEVSEEARHNEQCLQTQVERVVVL